MGDLPRRSFELYIHWYSKEKTDTSRIAADILLHSSNSLFGNPIRNATSGPGPREAGFAQNMKKVEATAGIEPA